MFLTRFIICNTFSAILIAVILILKKLLKNRASPKINYHIWFVLLFALTILFLPTSVLQIAGSSRITQEITSPSINVSGNSVAAPDMSDDWRYDFIEMVDNYESARLNTALAIVWVLGSISVGGYYFAGSRKLKTIRRFAYLPPGDVISVFDACCERVGVKRNMPSAI